MKARLFRAQMHQRAFFCLLIGILILMSIPGPALAQEQGVPPGSLTGVKQFTDLGADNAAWRYVAFLQAQGVVGGYPDGSFRPQAPVSRAEMAKMMTKLLRLPEVTPPSPTFKDVPPTHWAYKDVEAAAAAGLIKGYPGGSFGPENLLSRSEAAALVLRVAGQEPTTTREITDLPADHWAYRSAAEALEAGLLPATASGFSPQAPASRLEVSRGLALAYALDPRRATPELTPRLDVLEGEVWVTHGPGDRQRAQDGVVQPGSTIETGSDGRAELTFDDGSSLLLEPQTTLKLDQALGYRYIGSKGEERHGIESLEVHLDRGALFGALATSYLEEGGKESAIYQGFGRIPVTGLQRPWMRARLAALSVDAPPVLTAQTALTPWYRQAYTKKVRVKVNMPWGVAGIRGTFWKNAVTETEFSTSVLAGEAEVTAAGEREVLTTGQYTEAAADRAPTAPQAMPAQEKQAWVDKQAWVETAAQNIEENRPVPPAPEAQQLAGALLVTGGSVAALSPLPPPPPPTGTLPPATAEAASEAIEELATEVTAPPSAPSVPPAGTGESGDTGGGGEYQPPADIIPPQVTGKIPEPGASRVPVNTLVKVTFNEPLDAATVNAGTVKLLAGDQAVAGSVGYDTASYQVTFVPAAPLAYATTYTVKITTGIKDLAGNPLPQAVEWFFTTADRPEVTQLEVTWDGSSGSLRLEWGPAEGFNNYLVSWKPAGQMEYMGQQSVSEATYYTIGGLEADRAYTVRVQVDYGNGSFSSGKSLLAVTGRPPEPSPLEAGVTTPLVEFPPGYSYCTYPNVDGRWAVWQQVYYGGEPPSVSLEVYDLEYGHGFAMASHPVCAEIGVTPGVSGDRVAWVEGGESGPAIKVLDLLTGDLVQVSLDGAAEVYQISLDQDWLAWQVYDAGTGNRTVHWYNLATQEQGSAPDPSAASYEAKLLYPWIVWTEADYGSHIYAYDLRWADSATPLSLGVDTTTSKERPVLTRSADGRYWVAWLEISAGGASRLYLSELTDASPPEPKQIAPSPSNPADPAQPYYPAAGGSRVIWFAQSFETGAYDLYAYDLVTGTGADPFSVGAVWPYYSATDGSVVVWIEYGYAGNPGIRAYKLPPP